MSRPSPTCLSLGVLAVALVLSAGPAPAADPAQLGKELTPAGGERAASKDGAIPAWHGNEPQHSGWAQGKPRGDFFKYKADKPILTIDASNADQHAEKLSPGQLAVLKQVKGYKMDIYPSRRTCGVPDFVAENTRKNVGTAKLNDDGWSMKEASLPGFPFVFPQTGEQAMWNAKLRYRGVGVDFDKLITAVSPRKGSNEWIRAEMEFSSFIPWGTKGSTLLSTLPPVEYFVYFAYSSPTALAGQALTGKYFSDKAGNETFYYFPGQRRVRRMPTYAYDAPSIGMENQYTLDEPWMFNGSLDRFDWKLVGKKTVYAPYNAFGGYQYNAKFEDVAKDDFIDPAYRRYEQHRVWVVEATVKQGMRHTAPKRTYYLDEDSWNMVLAEDYDAQGKLAKMREGFLIPVFETGTCDVSAFVQHNLTEGRYVFDMSPVGTGKDARWVTDAKGARQKASFYASESLRAISDR